MKEQTIPVADATVDQLRDHATVNMGLEVDGRATRQSILAKLAAAGFKADTIRVQVPEDEPAMMRAPESAQVLRDEHGRYKIVNGKKYRCIIIPSTEQPGGAEPVPVGVNGRVQFIERNKESWVREPYVEALRNAVADVYAPYNPDIDGGRGGLTAPRSVQSYPFSVL